MPPRQPLTEAQLAAAATVSQKSIVVAAPGSGKTTVAAERYGILKFGAPGVARRALGLSFTRSATAELANRVRQRWGSAALCWPHEVKTLDSLHVEVLTSWLRDGLVEWPGGHTELTVLDTWRGQSGARYLLPDQGWRRAAQLTGRSVRSRGVPIKSRGYGIGTKAAFEAHLRAGLCTHEEVRSVVRDGLGRPEIREHVTRRFAETVRSAIIDEVFDANRLDLELIWLLADSGASVTLIGDPWQALYEFRGADPDLVPGLVESAGYDEFKVSDSFRFGTPQMVDLATDLRAGRGVALPHGNAEDCDVVLASEWASLWSGPEVVLPMSFGKIDNQSDACLVILLDHLVRGRFGHPAVFLGEATALLGLDQQSLIRRGGEELAPIVELLAGSGATNPEAVIAALRAAMRRLGSDRALRRLAADREAALLARIKELAARLGAEAPAVPGLTVHQAKGREWARVGVVLTEKQADRLAKGLEEGRHDDRVLYVALTRARESVHQL